MNHDFDPTDPRVGDPERDPRRGSTWWKAQGPPVAECPWDDCFTVLDGRQLANGFCPRCQRTLFRDRAGGESNGHGDEDVDALIGLQDETGEDFGILDEEPDPPIAGGATSPPFEVVSRTTWGARAPRYVAYMRLPAPDVWTHHTAGPPVYGGANATEATERAYVRGVQDFHMDGRGWSDIAYSFIVMPSGRIYVGRGFARTGGHTLDHNSDSHAWCHAGDYTGLVPTTKQLDAERWHIAEGKRLGYVGNGSIGGHRDVGQTSCPGDKLYAKLGYIRTPWTGSSEEDDLTKDQADQLARVDTFLRGLDSKIGAKAAGEHGSRLEAGEALGDKLNSIDAKLDDLLSRHPTT